jgi:hypothetical protein
MIDGKPMFPGKHYLDQISKIQVNYFLTFLEIFSQLPVPYEQLVI